MKEHWQDWARRVAFTIWARASNFERFILIFFPVVAVYDLVVGNWFDLVVAVIITTWVATSIWEQK